MLPVKVIASEWMTPRYPEGRIEEMVADSIGLRCLSKKDISEFNHETYEKLRSDFGIYDEARDIALAVAVARKAMQGHIDLPPLSRTS
ncbi:hypothetical protein IPS18_08430 [Xanthomonas perforans]|nr:hypothetical protein [Xanthomonas perforans]